MVLYRQITEEDIPVLLELFVDQYLDQDAFYARLNGTASGWAGLLEDRPVAFAVADQGTGELWKIDVLPSHQGKGIGRQLMRQAEAWLFSHGWEEIQVAIPEGLASASEFFLHLGWQEWKMENHCRYLRKTNPGPVYKLEEHIVSDPVTGYSRLVRLQRGPSNQPHRLCLFLDGEHYWRDMGAVPILNELCETGAIPRMTFAFIGHVSAAARHEDYTCNERYGRFITETVISWLASEVPGMRRENLIVAGLSLSGLMAVYLTLQYPRLFFDCLSQSGSHWWKPEWFARMAREKKPVDARFWLSVGSEETQTNIHHPPTGLFQEISQIDGAEMAAEVLKEIGGSVYLNRFEGSHAIRCWKTELSNALKWLCDRGVR